MADKSSNESAIVSPISTDSDVSKFDSSVASFLMSCEKTLCDAQHNVEKRPSRFSRMTVTLALGVALLSIASAFSLLGNGATVLQTVWSSIGGILLFAMVAVNGLMYFQGNHSSTLNHDVESELARYKELGSALGRLSRLRGEWSRGFLENESRLSAIRNEIEGASVDLSSKIEQHEAIKTAISNAEADRSVSEKQLSLLHDEIAKVTQQRVAIDEELTSENNQVANAQAKLVEFNNSILEERDTLELLGESKDSGTKELLILEKQRNSCIDAIALLTQQQSELIESVERMRADANELSTIEASLKQRSEENDAASAIHERLLLDQQQATNETASAKSQADECRVAVIESKAEIDRIQVEIAQSEKIRYLLNTELATRQQESDAVALHSGQKQRELSELTESLDKLRSQFADFDTQVIAAKVELELLEPQRTELVVIRNEYEQISRNLEKQRRALEIGLESIADGESTLLEQLERISSLGNEIQSGESQLSQLTEKFAFQSDELNRSAAVLTEIKIEITQLENARYNQIIDNKDLAESLEQHRYGFACAEQRIVELNQEMLSLKDSRDETFEENASLADQRARLVDSIEGLKQDSIKLQSEQAAIEIARITDNRNLAESREQHRLDVACAEQRIVELNAEIVFLKDSRDVIFEETSNLVDQRARLVDSIEALKQDSVTLRSEQTAIECARQTAAAAHDDLLGRQTELKLRFHQSTADHKQFSEQLELIQSEMERLRVDNARLQMKSVALKSQETSLRSEITELGSARDQANAEVAMVQTLLLDLNDQVERVQESLRGRDSIRLQILKLNEEKELLATQTHISTNELIALQGQVDAATEIINAHPIRLAQIDNEVSSKSDALLDLENAIADKQILLAQVSSHIEVQRSSLDSLQLENARLDEQSLALTSVNHGLLRQNDRLEVDRQECIRVSQLRDEAEKQLVTVRHEIEDANYRMNEIKEEIESGNGVIKMNLIETQQVQLNRNRLNQELADAQSAINIAEKRRLEVEADSQKFAMKSEDLKSKVHDLESEVGRLETLRTRGEVLRQQNGDLESQLAEKQNLFQQTEMHLQGLLARNTELTNAIDKLENSRESKEIALQALNQKADSQVESLASLGFQQRAIEKEILRSESVRFNRESEVRDLEESIELASAKKQQIEADIDQMKGEVSSWQDAAADVVRGRKELETIRVEKGLLISSVDQAKSLLVQAEQSLDELVGIRANAEQDLQAIFTEIEANRKTIADIQLSAGSLVDEVERLNQGKRSLEGEVSQLEETLRSKQREISAIESKDLRRQSIAIRELEETALQFADTERRLATAEESLRAQEVNVNDALAVSKQWDSYIASLRAKCEDLQQASLKSSQMLQATLAEKLRAEEELLTTTRQISESTSRAEISKLELSRLKGEIAASSDRSAAFESSFLEIKKNEQLATEMLRERTSQIDKQAEKIRSIEQEIAAKNHHLTELAIAEGRLIERCEAIELSIRNATAERIRTEEQGAMQRVVKISETIVPTVDDRTQSSREDGTATGEDLLDKIESLVEDIDRSRIDPQVNESGVSVRGLGAGKSVESTVGGTKPKETQATKQSLERKEIPPDPWASIFG